MGDTLVLVHVIFRHGNRTPDQKALYPKDPHKDVDYYPLGHGQLTNIGKRKAYRLGHILRNDYNKFLGDVYTPGIVDPLSSDIDRTKATVQLVLASLFAPKGEQVWQEGLTWQPIPYKFYPQAQCKFFLGLHRFKNSLDTYDEYMNGPGQKILESNSEVLQYIQENTGLLVNNTRTLLLVANTLQTEKDYGLELPSWTNSVWPSPLETLASLEFDVLCATPKLKAFTCGKMVEKIVEDTKTKMDGKSDCKMHLYSCHEVHVAAILNCLGLGVAHIPAFCSNVRLELHQIDGAYGFKVYYQRCIDEEPRLLTLPGCQPVCPFDSFVGLVRDVLEETAVTSYA